MLTRIVTTKVTTVTAVVALSATGAAAVTGSLPDAAQNGLANAAADIGINLPDTANDKARDATQPDADDADDDTPDASGSATTDEPSATTDEQGTTADADSSQTTRLPATRRKPCRPRQRRATHRTTGASSRRPRTKPTQRRQG